MKKNLIFVLGLLLVMGFTACSSEIEDGTTDIDSWPMPYEEVKGEYTYQHPCAMFNDADFTRVKTMLDDGTAPQAVKEEFEILKNSAYTSLSYSASPTEWIVRGDPTGTGESSENYANAMRDAAAAYQLALLWKLTGNKEYAATSVKVMNDWADKCKGIKSNDANQMLAAGAQGYTFANAAEIMQTYDGWADKDKTDFKKWIVDVFAAKNIEFMKGHGGQCSDHYWSNWDLVNMCSYMAIGILTENDDMVNYVVNYFYNGVGNGYIGKLIQGTFTDPLGSGEEIAQNQESGRDQGHAMMSVAVTANLCQMAYTFYQCNPTTPQLDFFAADNNAMMKMGEYTALFNLRDGADQKNANGAWLLTKQQMPFNPYKYCIDCACSDKNHGTTHTSVADDTGRGSLRPGWEIYYNHYAKSKKVSSGYKYAKQAADKMRPEAGADGSSRYGTNSGAFDQLGWGTLMLYRE